MASLSIVYFLIHQNYIDDLQYLGEKVPRIFNRYSYLMVAYLLGRERVYMNNTMISFRETPGYGRDLD